jgi:hypothetical protein
VKTGGTSFSKPSMLPRSIWFSGRTVCTSPLQDRGSFTRNERPPRPTDSRAGHSRSDAKDGTSSW